MPTIAVYNPVSGDSSAKAFFQDHVLPLLAQNHRTPDQVSETSYVGHAGELIVDFLESNYGNVTVIVGSGDGTLHEIINHLSRASIRRARPDHPIPRIDFVLVPCGTANALYSSLFRPEVDPFSTTNPKYKCQSVQSFISSNFPVPLQVAIGTLSLPPNMKAESTSQYIISAVVTSTSLHASILRDSESLRSEMPGIERFKAAAAKNSTKWYAACAKLLPVASQGVVQIYHPGSRSFIVHPESSAEDPIVDIDGPFVYFVSTINVDRLEPTFRVSPLRELISPSPTDASCDIVIIRPLRDPSLTLDDTNARAAFKDKLWSVLHSVYREGSHIDLLYDKSGSIVDTGDGPTVVEYIRCGGWEWIPDDLDEDAHLLCSDGFISKIEKGGRVVCFAAQAVCNAGFAVYV